MDDHQDPNDEPRPTPLLVPLLVIALILAFAFALALWYGLSGLESHFGGDPGQPVERAPGP